MDSEKTVQGAIAKKLLGLSNSLDLSKKDRNLIILAANEIKWYEEKCLKTLDNTNSDEAKGNTTDIKFFGNPDSWKLLCKASSRRERWMKSTKVMEIYKTNDHGHRSILGSVLQVSTQQGDNVAEAVTFIPGISFNDLKNPKK